MFGLNSTMAGTIAVLLNGVEYISLGITACACLVILIINKLLGYHVYGITGDALNKYYKYIYGCNRYVDGKPNGWCFGIFKNAIHVGYIGDYQEFGEKRNMCTLFCSKGLCEDLDILSTGDYHHCDIDYEGYIRPNRVSIPIIETRKDQMTLVTNALDFYKKNKYVKILLHGPPGTGKTYSRYAIGKSFDGCYFLNAFNPTEYSFYRFSAHHRTTSPIETKPLIVSFDEVDMIIDEIHEGTDKPVPISNAFAPSRSSGREMKNKKDWCEFMDAFSEGRYPYTIILCTTNKPLNHFNDLDPAYFRDGRINICMEFK